MDPVGLVSGFFGGYLGWTQWVGNLLIPEAIAFEIPIVCRPWKSPAERFHSCELSVYIRGSSGSFFEILCLKPASWSHGFLLPLTFLPR